MKNFSNGLAEELKHNLNTAQEDYRNPIAHAETALQLVLECMEKLRVFVKEFSFASRTEEIEFFKCIKPHFASKLIYFNEIYNFEVAKPAGNNKSIKKYYEKAENHLKEFYSKNSDFYKYYRSNNRSLDKKYFLRGKYDIKLFIESNFYQSDYDFTTSHDFIVARIIANDELQKYFEKGRSKDAKITNEYTHQKQNIIKWTGSKVALVELLYAMHASQVINNGQVSLKSIAQTAETVFNIDLGQFSRIFLEIKSRKSIERTSFLNALKNNLERKIEESDKM